MTNSKPQPSTEPKPKKRKGPLFQVWRGFWLAFLVASLAYAWHCFYTPSNSVSWAADYAAAEEQSIQSGKPMILFFTATWCVPCRVMKRTVWADEQVTAQVNESYIPLLVYADDPDMAEIFSRYQVGATPTTVVVDSQGVVLEWLQGKIEKADFLKLLETLKSDL